MLPSLSMKKSSFSCGFMLEKLSPQYSQNRSDLVLRKRGVHSVTFVIITKDRPEMIKHLIESILKTRLVSCSVVLVDDSVNQNFIKTRRFLQLNSKTFKQLSSSQAGRLVNESLRKTSLTTDEKDFIKKCTGLSSPFRGYAEQFLEQGISKPNISDYLRFAPYSPARNLGIYSAVRFFNPEIIIFLDDDCLILYPGKLRNQLELIESELNLKEIVAVAGLYKDLSARLFSEYTNLGKISGILRGMDKFVKESFSVGKARFNMMPPHILGGALILHKKAFSVIPFDPYVPRGEDHSYALDLKRFLAEDKTAIRDSYFIIGHQKEHSKKPHTQKRKELNVLRDTFRFAYIRTKTGLSFITLFLIRWTLTSLCSLLLDPSNYKRYKRELLALLFTAPKYAKENGSKFTGSIKAWNSFLSQLKM